MCFVPKSGKRSVIMNDPQVKKFERFFGGKNVTCRAIG